MSGKKIDTSSLSKKILDALGLSIVWMRGSGAGWFVDASTYDIVFGINADGQEVDLGGNGSTMENVKGILTLDAILKVKSFMYGLDCRTMIPKKTFSNPFFGLKSYEEISVTLDLLSSSSHGENSDD